MQQQWGRLIAITLKLVLVFSIGPVLNSEAQSSKNPGNPCAAKKMNPCNPCAAKGKMNPGKPCATKNPCAAKANPCNPCGPAGLKKESLVLRAGEWEPLLPRSERACEMWRPMTLRFGREGQNLGASWMRYLQTPGVEGEGVAGK
jgi:hypothetical protein